MLHTLFVLRRAVLFVDDDHGQLLTRPCSPHKLSTLLPFKADLFLSTIRARRQEQQMTRQLAGECRLETTVATWKHDRRIDCTRTRTVIDATVIESSLPRSGVIMRVQAAHPQTAAPCEQSCNHCCTCPLPHSTVINSHCVAPLFTARLGHGHSAVGGGGAANVPRRSLCKRSAFCMPVLITVTFTSGRRSPL